MTAAALATAPTGTVAPPPRLGLGRLLSINAFWFGNGAHWQPIFVALIPEGAKLVAGRNGADLLVGRATAAGGVFALLVPLIAGWLSDRTRTRWGRRRPWMIAGTAFNVLALALIAFAWAPAALIVFAVALQVGNNVAGAAYSGVIPDVVPEEQRGRASGLLGTMNQLGTVVGVLVVAIVLSVFGRSRIGLVVSYGVVAAILVSTLVITVLGTRERALPRLVTRHRAHRPGGRVLVFGAAATVTVVAVLALLTVSMAAPAVIAVSLLVLGGVLVSLVVGRRIRPLRRYLSALGDRDFRWCLLTRMFMNFGIFSIVPFMDSYFEKVAGSTNSGAASSYWLLAVIAGGVVPAVVGGGLSDRVGRRKPFVYASGALQAVAASVVIFSLVSSTVALYAVGLLFGVGYGLYYAIDWALACDVLPDKESSGRDMAIWHVSLTLPQVVAPALAAVVLTSLNATHHILGLATGSNLGFRVVFGSAALWFTLGTVFVSRIRGVR